jgi:uncharacterized membrane protein YqjE
MAYEHLRDSALPRIVTSVIADVAQLFQAEVRLAKAEIASNVTAKLQSIVGFAIAGVFGLVTLLLIAQAVVFLLIARGIEAHWATLIVAAVFCVLAAVSAAIAMSKARQELAPQRTVHQVSKDIRVVKEQLQ